MPTNNLETRAYRAFYRTSKKKLDCRNNSKPCKCYETSTCDFSCFYAQAEKNRELESRKPKHHYFR